MIVLALYCDDEMEKIYIFAFFIVTSFCEICMNEDGVKEREDYM